MTEATCKTCRWWSKQYEGARCGFCGQWKTVSGTDAQRLTFESDTCPRHSPIDEENGK